MTSERLIGAAIGAAPFVAHKTAVVVCEWRAAKAETDGEDDWEDLFWPRLLRRLDKARYTLARQRKAGVEMGFE